MLGWLLYIANAYTYRIRIISKSSIFAALQTAQQQITENRQTATQPKQKANFLTLRRVVSQALKMILTLRMQRLTKQTEVTQTQQKTQM